MFERDTTIRWAQVEVAQDDQVTLHEVWLDLSRKPHRTGRTVWWLNKNVIEASIWLHRKEKFAYHPHSSGTEDQEEDDQTVTIAGLRTSHFPSDDGWYMAGEETTKQNGSRRRQSDITIQNVTQLNTRLLTANVRPNCEAAWNLRMGRILPWPEIWGSLGTELSDATEESRWFRNLHRAIFVRNRQTETSQLCRLECNHEESMLHFATCLKIRPFWDTIFLFLASIDIPPPTNRTEAILFNLWETDILGPIEARATIRHAFGEIYRRFALVDLAKLRFDCTAAALSTLQSLRRAVIRRAASIRKMHANRLYTHKPNVIPQTEAEKFPGLITMSTDGCYTISETLERAIETQKTKLTAEALQRTKDANRIKLYTKKRTRPPPHRN